MPILPDTCSVLRDTARAGLPKRKPYRLPSMLEALVLAVLEESNRPLTAYDIADRSTERGQPLTAAQVYRVLHRLTTQSKVQRIELLSAWLISQGDRQGFLVCRCCHSVERLLLAKMGVAIDRLCRAAGFTPARSLVEVSGVCRECADRDVASEEVAGRRTDKILMNGVKGPLSPARPSA